MADKKDIMIPPQGMWRGTLMRIKLILHLIGDRRVNPWLKILPIGGLLYLISPLDIIPDIALPIIGELDDLAILWLTNYLFIEMCPPDVVKEHIKRLTSNMDIVESQDDVVDGEAKDITNKK